MRLSLYYGLPILRRDFCLRRILAVRIWRNLLFLIGCVIGSREEHLCLVHVLFWCSDVVGCCQPFVTEAASETKWTCGVLRLSSVRGWFLRWSSVVVMWLWFFLLSFVVSEMDHGLRCGCATEFGFWSGPFVLCWHCLGSVRGLLLRWILLVSSSEPSLADQISAWGRLWSMIFVVGHGFHDELFN